MTKSACMSIKTPLLTLLALTIPLSASADTLDVCSGCTYTTIEGAIDVANPGDLIQVAAGNYGNFDVDMRVVEVNDEAVVLDANHPLAGETITYSVEVRSVKELSEEDLRKRRELGPARCEHDDCDC